MPARIALAGLALLALAYLAISLRNVDSLERGERLATQPDPPVAEAERLLERARLLNPDVRPLLAEAALLSANGRPRDARALAERAVSREPDNVFAWSVLAGVTRESDPARARQALARGRELSPPVD
jgi:tetratricopeptide (TPR) repeat protein